MRILILICLVVQSGYVYSANVRVDPLVLIEQGLVRGFKSSDGDYSTFLGIPYAKVDEQNPFGSAILPDHFKETIYEANNGDVLCPQVNKQKVRGETLDCLRLNIYVPSSASTRNPLPVLIWIHGGGFATGYGALYDPKELVKKGIVVVTINYRLGPYGFMCLNTAGVPGNQGLKDQNLAIEWVRENIAAFGGNPYQVTIAGQSAGSISVLLHLYSSKDKLYKQVIAHSGTPQNDAVLIDGDVDVAKKLSLHLGFNATDSESALEFLSTTSTDLVTAAAVELQLPFLPCLEKSFSGVENFIEYDAFSLSNPRKVKNTAILIGHTSVEYRFDSTQSTVFTKDYFASDPFYRRLQTNFDLDEDELQNAADVVRHFYIGDNVATEDNIADMEEFESDFVWNHPIEETINNLINENAAPVYEYMFSYTGDTGNSRASHSEDLLYLFDVLGYHKSGSEDDDMITDRMTTLWSNFVKYGNPTPEETSFLPVTWEPVTTKERPYLNIDSKMTLEHRVYSNRMAFWDVFMNFYKNQNKLVKKCTR